MTSEREKKMAERFCVWCGRPAGRPVQGDNWLCKAPFCNQWQMSEDRIRRERAQLLIKLDAFDEALERLGVPQ